MYNMNSNPFGDKVAYSDLERNDPRLLMPFDVDDESPIAAALHTEISRQASILYHCAIDGDDDDIPTFDEVGDDDLAAIFSNISTCDSGAPMIARSVVPPQNKPPARTKSAAHGNKLSPAWSPVRSASAKAVIGRRKSSRNVLKIPADQSISRPASNKSISMRAGAIAAGDNDTIAYARSHSNVNITEAIATCRSESHSPRPTTQEEQERLEQVMVLIEYKFRKHMSCATCENGFTCQCEPDCTEPATLYAERYGRLGNKFRVKPGYYSTAHLVEEFIDAYDEEKLMKEAERETQCRRATRQ